MKQLMAAPRPTLKAAEEIFALFRNASYFSTRNAEQKQQMLEGWAQIIERNAATCHDCARHEAEVENANEEIAKLQGIITAGDEENRVQATTIATLREALTEILQRFPSADEIDDLKADAGLGYRKYPAVANDKEIVKWWAALAATEEGK